MTDLEGRLLVGVGSAVLGWLFGLLTPQIVDSIRRRYDRKRIAAALSSELRETRERLAAVFYYILSKHGQLTTLNLEWAAAILDGAQYHPRHRRVARHLRGLIAQGPEALNRLNAHNLADFVNRNRRISARRFETPYLTSILSRMDVFPTGVRQALLSIDAQFKMFNEIVDECREYSRLTFNPAITDENRQAVVDSLRQTERLIADRAEYLAILIGNLDLNSNSQQSAEILADEPASLDEQTASENAELTGE